MNDEFVYFFLTQEVEAISDVHGTGIKAGDRRRVEAIYVCTCGMTYLAVGEVQASGFFICSSCRATLFQEAGDRTKWVRSNDFKPANVNRDIIHLNGPMANN